jgi:hypothetical protein
MASRTDLDELFAMDTSRALITQRVDTPCFKKDARVAQRVAVIAAEAVQADLVRI